MLKSKHKFLKVFSLLFIFFSIWLMISLLSFNPSDPSWSQTSWNSSINNLGGICGAWMADLLFFIFGVIAYAIPVIIISGCWFNWLFQRSIDYIDYFEFSFRLIGAIALISTSCSLAATNVDDIWYFASGGVLGSLISTALQEIPTLHNIGGRLVLLWIWAVGLALFTGWSWKVIFENIGALILNILTFINNAIHEHYRWASKDQYEGTDDYEKDSSASSIR